jgi:hypothetical protein
MFRGATMPGDRPDLQDLIDNPPEVLDVELKDWIDIASDRVVQANIARHIAALANHGGGYLIFGFHDSRAANPSLAYPIETYNRDILSSIVKRYLTPTFQCEVDFVTSGKGVTHPVVWVPSHAAVPVCSKADGPHDERGRPQGIKIATHYVRAPGPESVQITTPEQWGPIIRRCIIHERTALVGMFDSLLRAPQQPNPTEALKRWHDRTDGRFIELAPKHKAPPSVLQSRVAFSYAIRTPDGELLDPGSLIETLREVNQEVHDLFNSPLLFYPYTRPELAPYFIEDSDSDQGSREILECAIFPDAAVLVGTIVLWRVSLDGLCTHVSPLWEDREDMRQHSGREPGTWFCPYYMVRLLAELTRHARALAARFAVVEAVEFRCEWHGLAQREVFDPRLIVHWREGNIAKANHRVTAGEWTVAELAAWPRIVSMLGGPVMRLFDPRFEFSPEWVAQQESWFRR